MNILFHTNFLSIRGTEVALYDYAYYNQLFLKNKSIIISKGYENENIFNKFKKYFKVYLYDNLSELNDIINKENIDLLYCIKSGENDGINYMNCKTVIHCVFNSTQKHGDVYSVISEDVNIRNNTNYPVVPHMINLPEENSNLRNKLNIPENAYVFGRYGGFETFDIDFVYNVINKICAQNKNVYFLFMNTQKFNNDFPNKIIFLESNTDLSFKKKFINTCNSLLHARFYGESFGLTVGEFAINKKQIISFNNKIGDHMHKIILQDKIHLYNNENELSCIMNNVINGINLKDMNENGYFKYTPEYVMNIFKNVFLENNNINVFLENNNITFVTGFFNLNRESWKYWSRNLNVYLNNAKRILSIDNPMVIFIEKEFEEFVIENRKNKKTKIIIIKLEELEYYKYKNKILQIMQSKEFINNCVDKNVPEMWNADYNIVTWSKLYLMFKAIQLDYFGTDFFAWIDFGLHTHIFKEEYINTKLFENNIIPKKIKILCRSIPQKEDLNINHFFKSHTNRFAAGLITGSKENFVKFFNYQNDIIKEALSLNVVDCEQSLYAVIYLKYPELFELYYGDWNDIISNYI